MSPRKQNNESAWPPGKNRFEGLISINSRGVGYLAADGPEDIEIHEEHLNTALPGDEVRVALLPRVHGRRVEGEVLEVVKRAKTEFVGTVEKEVRGTFVVPDNRRVYVDFLLSPDEASKLKQNDKVIVRLLPWTDPKKNPPVEIVGVLGQKGEHNVEMEAIVRAGGFQTQFPQAVLEEAHAIKSTARIDAEEIARRKDYRGVPTFTIDPVDAKDFDDALSFRALPDGTFEVGIHIADASHYVTPDSALDREAIDRATSIYLVDRTIPMLPEELSNDLCSLNADEDKLAFSAIFTIDQNAAVRDRWFGKTVIRSDKRFAYEEAQEVITRGEGLYVEELQTLNRLAKTIKERRFADGAIEFEEDEVRFELDEKGRPIAVKRKQRLDAHKLIEEFMLLANREVAEYIHRLEKQAGKTHPFVYRIHDVPNLEKIQDLATFVRAIGHDLVVAPNGTVSSKDLNALFKRIEGEATEGLIKTAAVRAMAKAVYSTGNIGHFGLAFGYYTHFTSPIRRYPDIMVHRLLAHYLANEKVADKEVAQLQKQALHASRREVEATEAERASIRYKHVEFMRAHVGETFEGVISGVTEWGIYVEDLVTKAEGMIRIRDLGDDYYELDKQNYRLVGTRTKKTYSLGDKIKVKLTAADLDRKTLDFVIA
jgi:ribonuclease R